MTQLSGIDARAGCSYLDLEHFAKIVRKTLGVQPCVKFDAQECFEFQLDEITVQHAGHGVRLAHGIERLNTEGLTRWDPESHRLEVLLSTGSYESLCRGYPRPRYTVAHELGHVLLHTGEIIRLGQLDARSQAAMHRGAKEHPAYRDTEWQANAFASALLMPVAAIHAMRLEAGRLPTPDAVARAFGVSVQAAQIRLDNFRRGKLGF
jgi:hypothetical protein